MSDTLSIVVPPDLFGRLGRGAAPAAAFSPFGENGGGALDADARGTLRRLSAVDGSGALAPRLTRACNVLATARAAVRLELTGGVGTIEYDQWFDPDGGPSVSLTPADDGIRLDDPAAGPAVVELVAQMLGGSRLQGAELEVELEATHALVLAALVDAHRLELLRTAAGCREIGPIAFDTTAIRSAVLEPGTGPQWLAAVLTDAHQVNPPDAADIDAALGALVAAGHLDASGGSVALAHAARDLAERLPVVERVLRLTAGRERADGEIVRAGFTCVQAGALDLLTLERVDDVVRIATTSAATVVGHVTHFLTHADALAELPAPVAPGATAGR